MRAVSRIGRQLSPALLIGMLIAAMAVQPVLANHELGHRGTVGFHALVDTQASPGATCTYRELEPIGGYWEGYLRRISVAPPRMRAIAAPQKVGWQFTVQRKESFEGASTAWYETYTSPWQNATTNSTSDASFTSMSVRVFGANSTDGSYSYRVLVKMRWYRANGTTQGTAIHKVDNYRLVEGTYEGRSMVPRCFGVESH